MVASCSSRSARPRPRPAEHGQRRHQDRRRSGCRAHRRTGAGRHAVRDHEREGCHRHPDLSSTTCARSAATSRRRTTTRSPPGSKSGAATVEIHPIAILTTKSAGTQYSTRAANAAACVADYSPDPFFDFNTALFRDQPQEGTTGWDDGQLVSRAQSAGVGHLGNIKDCIDDRRFVNWVQAATVRALNGPIPNSDVRAIAAAPTIIVNGKQFKYSRTSTRNRASPSSSFRRWGRPTTTPQPRRRRPPPPPPRTAEFS